MNNKLLPQLDLHGLDRISASIFVKSFLKEQYLLGNRRVVIIHGIGKGILKETVIKILKASDIVVNYETSFFNLGCTIVNLK